MVGSAAASGRAWESRAKAGSVDAVECFCGEGLDTGRLLPQKAEKCGPDRRWKRPGPPAVETNEELI